MEDVTKMLADHFSKAELDKSKRQPQGAEQKERPRTQAPETLGLKSALEPKPQRLWGLRNMRKAAADAEAVSVLMPTGRDLEADLVVSYKSRSASRRSATGGSY